MGPTQAQTKANLTLVSAQLASRAMWLLQLIANSGERANEFHRQLPALGCAQPANLFPSNSQEEVRQSLEIDAAAAGATLKRPLGMQQTSKQLSLII